MSLPRCQFGPLPATSSGLSSAHDGTRLRFARSRRAAADADRPLRTAGAAEGRVAGRGCRRGRPRAARRAGGGRRGGVQRLALSDGLDDSKALTALARERLYELILAKATISVAVASRERIDRMNILRASLWAMSRAVRSLACRPDYVLVDGNMMPPGLPCPARRSSTATPCRCRSRRPRSSPRSPATG